MRTEFRNRVFLPVVLPLAILGAMALLIGIVAWVLLYNTHEGALAVAGIAAAGILFTVALASSQDRLDPGRRSAVVFAAIVPFAIGGAFAAGLIGDIADEDRNINAEPHLVVPEGTPVIAAENSQDFCIPTDGGCEVADLWELTPAEFEGIAFIFDNREAGIPHNVVITELEGDVDDPAPVGQEFIETTVITGPAEDVYLDEEQTWDDLPEQWYFFCRVHPNMNGVGQVVAEG